jgi:hypothetical protein
VTQDRNRIAALLQELKSLAEPARLQRVETFLEDTSTFGFSAAQGGLVARAEVGRARADPPARPWYQCVNAAGYLKPHGE